MEITILMIFGLATAEVRLVLRQRGNHWRLSAEALVQVVTVAYHSRTTEYIAITKPTKIRACLD